MTQSNSVTCTPDRPRHQKTPPAHKVSQSTQTQSTEPSSETGTINNNYHQNQHQHVHSHATPRDNDEFLQLTEGFNQVAISDNNHYNNAAEGAVEVTMTITTYTTMTSIHHANLDFISDDNFHVSTNNTPKTTAPYQNNQQCCEGINVDGRNCNRPGKHPVLSYDNNRNPVTRKYCYQHEPTFMVERRCLASKASGGKYMRTQCSVTCTPAELRDGERYICTSHYKSNFILFGGRN
ncbi:hypothetical protein BKA57DRAFT_449728 [Linnemannia elongata]|nr:hypothetical protein BKA57DRAFT_449728 [Linnemannia elongata]